MNLPQKITAALSLLGFIGIEVVKMLRRVYTGSHNVFSYALGVGPNFFAGVGLYSIIAFFVLGMCLKCGKPRVGYILAGYLLAYAVSNVIIISWEYRQEVGELVFDVHDIYATLAGTTLCLVLCLVLFGRLKTGSDKAAHSA